MMESQSSTQDDNQTALKIIEICKEADDGVPHDVLSREIQVAEQKVIEILNQLIRGGHITVKQNADNIPVYHFQDQEKARRFAGLDRDHMAIYKLIEDADANGLSKNDIKSKSGMNPTALNNILNALKKKNLIKSEKAVNQKNRNVWILFELEPSMAVRGSIFYAKGEFRQQYVDTLYEKIFNYIESHSKKQDIVGKREIALNLRSSEFASDDLKDEDIQKIIDILVFDDKIEELPGQRYKSCDWELAVKSSVLSDTPCGNCPVFLECREGSIISPEKCIYFLQW